MWLSRSQQALLHCLFLISLIQGNGNRACLLSVIYPRSKLIRTVGDSLTLNCTVKFCANEIQKHEAHWCILEASSCQPMTSIRTPTDNGKGRRILVSHTIAFLNLSDSGIYRCEASQGDIKAMGHSIVVNVTVASDTPVTPVTPVEHADNTYKWSFLALLPLLVVIVCVILYCREKRRSAQKSQRAQKKNITAASSPPTITMVTTEPSSTIDATELGRMEAHVEPFYVNEPFPINERCDESIYANDLSHQ